MLTLEYAPGIKVTNVAAITAAGLDAPAVAQRATESYLIQILRHGFFHAGACLCACLLGGLCAPKAPVRGRRVG